MTLLHRLLHRCGGQASVRSRRPEVATEPDRNGPVDTCRRRLGDDLPVARGWRVSPSRRPHPIRRPNPNHFRCRNRPAGFRVRLRHRCSEKDRRCANQKERRRDWYLPHRDRYLSRPPWTISSKRDRRLVQFRGGRRVARNRWRVCDRRQAVRLWIQSGQLELNALRFVPRHAHGGIVMRRVVVEKSQFAEVARPAT